MFNLEELERRVGIASQRAREVGEPVLATTSCKLAAEVDVSLTVLGARGDEESWFCFDQPNRGVAVAGLGAAATVKAGGAERYQETSKLWRQLVDRAVAGDDIKADREGPTPVGLVGVGGFAFAADSSENGPWSEFGPGKLVVPEVLLSWIAGECFLTVTVSVGPGSEASRVVPEVGQRVQALLDNASSNIRTTLKPATSEAFSALPPAHFEQAVATAVHRIKDGEFEKIVLARELRVEADNPFDVAAVFEQLRQKHPGCFICCVGGAKAAFVAASPELLVRRHGDKASTIALAGSRPRGKTPDEDRQLGEELLASRKDRGEQAIVTQRIVRALKPYSAEVDVQAEPSLMKMANIQHLATPIEATLAEKTSAIELLERLHPTPAVGAEPPEAVSKIADLEELDRGWYAGPIGWVNAADDGEFCVGLRSALITGAEARLYAGVGVVKDSDPASELAETETKFSALLPVLVGSASSV